MEYPMSVPCLLLLCSVMTFESSHSQLFTIHDPISQLNTNNFSQFVHKSSKMWIVDYYAAWCGYCQRMAPEFAALAHEIQDWSPVVELGAVSCPDSANLCRLHNVNGYPTVKFFPPNSEESFHGYHYEGDKYRANLKGAVLQYLNRFLNEHLADATWPKLNYVRHPRELWKEGTQRVFIVVEDDAMASQFLGLSVILDTLDLRPDVMVARMNRQHARHYGVSTAGVYEATAFGTMFLYDSSVDSNEVVERIRMDVKGEQTVANVKFGPVTSPMVRYRFSPAKGLHMQDLESGLYYTLWIEVSSHSVLNEDALKALKNYIRILAKYHPGENHVKEFLKRLNEWLQRQPGPTLSSHAWLNKLTGLQTSDAFIPERILWTGCNGSEPRFRRYPCSLWMTFHALTVNAYITEIANITFDPLDVLLPIRHYMHHFFGCRQCAKNFVRGTQRWEQKNASRTSHDVVLWLWKAHNRANFFLHSDPTEDPDFPKIQFPSYEDCAYCRVSGTADERFQVNESAWREDKVVSYLVRFYGNSFIVDDDVEDFTINSASTTTLPANQVQKSVNFCHVLVTEWSTCSRSCDVGTSTRFSNNNTGCLLTTETRLCLQRPCSVQFPDWSRSPSECLRSGHTYRLARPIPLEYGNCSTTMRDRWRICGVCPTINRHRPVCCHPARSSTQLVDVMCKVKSIQTNSYTRSTGKVFIEVVDYCQCSENLCFTGST